MNMQIHCPGCGVRLEVPESAGGRAARCPACKTKFRVPDPKTMLDETVTCWLGLDQLGREEDAAEQTEDQAAAPAADSADPEAKPSPSASAPAGEAETAEGAPTSDAGSTTAGSTDAPAGSVDSSGPPEPDTAAPDSPGKPTGSASPSRGAGSFTVAYPAAPTSRPAPDAEPSATAADSATPVVHRRQGGGNSRTVIDHSDDDRPLLHVLDVGAFGVRLAFNSRLLNQPPFRASMPMQSVGGTENAPGDLIARPLAWLDKATGHFTNPGELETRYELRVKPHCRARDVVAAMPTIDELPAPFNQPMPYYVGRSDHGGVAVHCETVATPRGVQCEVVIPNITYALEWVGRVNGVCSEAYQVLEREASKFEAEAWQAIPDEVRHRFAVWFEFQGSERFLGYFNDSEFAKADAGLAGLVVTDQRLVYCKYHHHGQVRLQPGLRIVAEEQGRFAKLVAEKGGNRRKLVNLRCGDLAELEALLGGLDCGVRFERVVQQPCEDAAESAGSTSGRHVESQTGAT